MKEEQHRFLSVLGRVPARLTSEQTAWLLNCQPHDIPPLVTAKLLKPLGNPSANSVKFFATSELMELIGDRNWLGRVSAAIYQHWRCKNTTNKGRLEATLSSSLSSGDPGNN